MIEAYPMVKKLTEDVCGGAMLYAELIHEKLRKAGYYDDEGQFDVTEQVIICDINFVLSAWFPLNQFSKVC